MELSLGEIIQKPKMQEFSSLLMIHLLSVMHALVKFHEYISYGLGVMAWTQLTDGTKSSGNNSPKMPELSSLFMTHRLNVMYAPVKFHEYIPYGLGVMARTRSGTYRRTDGRTDRRTGRTGVILNAHPLFFE